MKRLLIGCLLIVGLALLGCATTNQATSLNRISNREIKAYNNDPNNTDKIVCKEETPIGSKIPRRTCRKESLIKRTTRQDRRAIEEIQERTRLPDF